MKKFEVKRGTHIVLKVADVEKYLNESQIGALHSFIKTINNGRLNDKKELNDYYVVNHKEPYSDKVYEIIINGEIEKGELKWQSQRT